MSSQAPNIDFYGEILQTCRTGRTKNRMKKFIDFSINEQSYFIEEEIIPSFTEYKSHQQ